MAEYLEKLGSGSRSVDNYQVIDYRFAAQFHVHLIMGDPVQAEMEMEMELTHWHTEVEVVATYRGHAEHFIDGKRYQSHPGSVIITNSCSLHSVRPDPTLEPAPDEISAIVLHIRTDLLRDLFPNADDLVFTPVSDTDNPRLSELIRRMAAYSDEKEAVGQPPPVEYEFLHIISLLTEILYEISKDRITLSNGAIPVSRRRNVERIRDAIVYVQDHYAEPITEAQIAEQFYFSKEYFARLFKKNTNMTFMEFLTTFRVSKGWELLLSSDRTMTDIALECGFSDSRGFINAFKRRYGSTPLQYKKKRERENQ